MSTAEIKSLGPRFFKEQDRLRGGPADELCASNYVAHIGSNPPMNLAGHKQLARMFYEGFPDLDHTIDDTIAEGDKVVVRFTARGTHKGNFMGIPATRKSITVGAVMIFHVVNGKVAELRGQFDQMGMMQQLGVMLAP
jgi:steroid delta-isomerase-like uncharacterized protein